MKRVWIGATVGALLGIAIFLCSMPHHSSELTLVFVVVVSPLAMLGAHIGGVQAILRELRAMRRQRAMDMDMDDRRESSTGIKDL
jgi:hypothetical protein